MWKCCNKTYSKNQRQVAGRCGKFLDSLWGPNLAKGDFLAKYSRSEAKTGEKSICHADRGAPYGALSGRKVRIMDRLRSFEHTGGVNPNKRVVEVRQNAWSYGKSELLVHAQLC